MNDELEIFKKWRDKEIEAIKTDAERKKCIGCYFESNKNVYYAISGIDRLDFGEEEFYKQVSNGIIGILNGANLNGKRCIVLDATYFYEEEINASDYSSEKTHIYELASSNKGEEVTVTLTQKIDLSSNKKYKIKKADYYSILKGKYISTKEDSRFSCVERKIIGKVHSRDIMIYCSRRPCYLCLPGVTKVIFESGNKNKKYHSLNVKANEKNNTCTLVLNDIM